jgi:hypothetical protein
VSSPLERLDRAAGLAIDAAVGAHHRRRLRRVGRLDQLEPPDDGRLWAAGPPPPRAGCELEVLVGGAEALPMISEALAEARLEVNIAGWHITPGFGLDRDEGAKRLRDRGNRTIEPSPHIPSIFGTSAQNDGDAR